MSGRLRLWIVLCSLIPTESTTAVAEDHPAAVADVVTLAFREPKSISDADEPAPFLARELVRQSFLIAARDECGLRTCDATLREEIPNAPSVRAVPFELFCTVKHVKPSFEVRSTLRRQKGSTTEELGVWKFQTDVFSPNMLIDLSDLAERMSRGTFKNLIKHQGLGNPVPAAREFAGVPRGTENQLWEWNEFAVLGALRRIHAEIRAKGESPELLAGLVVGYANLGTLTENYHSPAHKAFSARSLLYAERLVHELDGSDWALWHRAYARAIVGLHDHARVDVKAAKKLWDKELSKRLPFWTEILDSFTRGQLPEMFAKAKTQNQRRLARYLNLEAVGYSDMNDVALKAGHAMLEECPDCTLAADTLCSISQIGPLNEITSSAFPQFSKSLRRRLPEVDGFPAGLAKRLGEIKPAEAMTENAIEEEIEFRLQLVADIKAESVSGRDTLEPSLAVVGQFIEEIQFMQIMRRLQLEGSVWAIPTEQTIATYQPLCAHHPYGKFVVSYGKDKAEADQAAQTLLHAIDPSELGLLEWPLLNWLRLRSMEPGTLWLSIAWCHADPIFGDEMMGLDQGLAGPPDEKHYNRPHMNMLWRTSSMLPAALAIQIARDWEKAKLFSATAEHDYADDPLVMAALANRYLKLKRFEDAERCAKQRIRVAPDYAASNTLAAIYQAKGDMVRWKETLEKALDLPSMGLEQANIQDRIAHYHMGRKEWKEAVAYADAAAESYSEWSMMTAARCHEMLGEWAKSEAYMRAISERYANSALEWMLWCHRTGHGDLAAADTCARTHFESLGTSFYGEDRQKIGIYYLLRNEPEKALVVFKQTFAQTHNVYNAMHAAIVADTIRKTAERDELFSQLSEANPADNPHEHRTDLYKQVVEALRKALPPGSIKDFDFKKMDEFITESTKVDAAANLEYFVGMFLKNRGVADKSREYLIRCAQSPFYNKYTYVVARKTLRDLKIPIPDPPATAQAAVKK